VTDAAQGTPDDSVITQSGIGSEPQASLVHTTLTGLRQPIVLVLLLIAFFTSISGRVLDGILMLTVALLLASDAGRTRLRSQAGLPATGAVATGGAQAGRSGQDSRGARRLLIGLAWLAAGLLYAVLVGAFERYSWPITACVISLSCLMVAIGWQGPLRQRQALTGQPLRRAWLWGVVVCAGGLWELSSLLQQPHLTTDSYAHPTISALTDPLLGSHPGRSLVLAIWLLLGWFLAGR
jgi:hypothetical protein